MLPPKARPSSHGRGTLPKKKNVKLITRKERGHDGIRIRDLRNWELLLQFDERDAALSHEKCELTPNSSFFWPNFHEADLDASAHNMFALPPYLSIILYGVIAFFLFFRNFKSLYLLVCFFLSKGLTILRGLVIKVSCRISSAQAFELPLAGPDSY